MLSILWFTQEEQSQVLHRRTEAEKLTRDAELFKLRQQLQPHFLFNSLNSISALAGSQPEKARHMIQQLSDFLRGTLRKEEQQWMPLKEELHYLELYLDIEKVRFGHRLQTITNYEENILDFSVPAMLLQPVVENAIKFGLYDTIDAVTISIDAHADSNKQLVITISNPFDPETTSAPVGTGFGLSSIQRRLFLLFARTDLLQTKTDNNIFTTILIIPQLNDKSNPN
jgi:LytS/YehU family sensor histidine kinase